MRSKSECHNCGDTWTDLEERHGTEKEGPQTDAEVADWVKNNLS